MRNFDWRHHTRLAALLQRLNGESKTEEAALARLVEEWRTLCGGTGNSFTPTTPVLLANGTTKPIKDIRVGDQVQATDPVANVTRPEPVTATITGTGTKALVDIQVDPVGQRGPPAAASTATITATANHPFCAPELRQWVNAIDLQVGQLLQTSTGTHAQITAVQHRSADTTVNNLTVANLHTYYVMASHQSVLVHNAGCFSLPGDYVRTIPQKRLQHTFDEHAREWFGGEPKASEKMAEWRSLIERAMQSSQVFPWDSRGRLTYAYLARLDGKWFVVQFDRNSGELVTAFVPKSGQLGAMLNMLGK